MAKTLAMVFGWIFVIVGVLGFFHNGIVGSGAYFETNTLHSVVHLLVGVILLGVAYMAAESSAMALIVFGIIYLALALLGFMMGGDKVLGLMINRADNWLHLVLGVVLLCAGWMNKSSAPAATM